jgi:hypothetical protein
LIKRFVSSNYAQLRSVESDDSQWRRADLLIDPLLFVVDLMCLLQGLKNKRGLHARLAANPISPNARIGRITGEIGNSATSQYWLCNRESSTRFELTNFICHPEGSLTTRGIWLAAS